MKKFFALVLVVCMMMATAALADGPAVQDQKAPEVITTNEAGEIIAAKVYDAQGNEIAQVKEESLILTDVHFREEVEDAAIAERLTATYEGIMNSVHFSDGACAAHEHTIKVDIDEALAGTEGEFDAYDLVMAELFDIAFDAETAALLVDGAYVEITFAAAPLISLFTADGANWEIAEAEAAEGSTTIKLTQPGVLSMCANGREVVYIGETTEEEIETVVEGSDPGSYDVHFDNFTPSVSGKEAPEVVTFAGTDGEDYVAYIRNSTGAVVAMVPNKNYIVVTAVSESIFSADIQTYEQLESNFGDVMDAENIGMLTSDAHEGTIAADIDAVLQAMNTDLTCDQLVIKDLFEVSAYGDYVEYMYEEGAYLEVTFDAGIDSQKALVVIHSVDSENWHVHPAEDIKVNADGTVTLNLKQLGAVAFLVEAEVEPAVEEAVQSPN